MPTTETDPMVARLRAIVVALEARVTSLEARTEWMDNDGQ